jgi:hypothetical protein
VAGLLTVIASAALVRGALPRRSPFRRSSLVLVLLHALAAAVCFNLATWGQNRMIQDDWGQLAVAVLIIAMAQLRPPAELASAALLSAAVLGVNAAFQAGFLMVTVNPIVYAIVAATTPAILGLGAAAYGRNMLRATAAWRTRAHASMAELEPQLRESVTRSVQQTYVTALNRQAVPLLERVLSQGEITRRDVDAAATVSHDLRGQAIGMLHVGWLGDAIERALDARGVVVDIVGDRSVVDAVGLDQRAVFTAAILDIFNAPSSALSVMTISAQQIEYGARMPGRAMRGRSMARLELVASVKVTMARAMHTRLMPYLAVLRVISEEADLRVTGDRIELGFSYELV